MQKPELLSPAGNLEKMKTALAFGADAIYAGIPDFSLRTRINDFNLNKIRQATKYCHSLNKKIYITINIVAHNKHFKNLEKYIVFLKKIKVDALIISDPGVINFVKKIWPKCNIHLSTQANCINLNSAKFWYLNGIKRVVLGREASINDIIEIHEKVPKLELECFVHGAMCMAYSGRCFLSKFFVNKSGNLGNCVQPCRWSYKIKHKEKDELFLIASGHEDKPLEIVEEEHGSYILNSRDLCLIKKLDKLINAGIVSFKIEGRAKSSYYIANVIGAYQSAIQIYFNKKLNKILKTKKINNLFKELVDKLVHRGYTQGFTFGNGKMAQALSGSHNKCDWEFCGQVIYGSEFKDFECKSFSKNFKNNKKKLILIKVHNSIKVGDIIEIVSPYYEITKFKLKKIFSQNEEELSQAHGGQDKIVFLEVNKEVPEFSVLRRKLNN